MLLLNKRQTMEQKDLKNTDELQNLTHQTFIETLQFYWNNYKQHLHNKPLNNKHYIAYNTYLAILLFSIGSFFVIKSLNIWFYFIFNIILGIFHAISLLLGINRMQDLHNTFKHRLFSANLYKNMALLSMFVITGFLFIPIFFNIYELNSSTQQDLLPYITPIFLCSSLIGWFYVFLLLYPTRFTTKEYENLYNEIFYNFNPLKHTMQHKHYCFAMIASIWVMLLPNIMGGFNDFLAFFFTIIVLSLGGMLSHNQLSRAMSCFCMFVAFYICFIYLFGILTYYSASQFASLILFYCMLPLGIGAIISVLTKNALVALMFFLFLVFYFLDSHYHGKILLINDIMQGIAMILITFLFFLAYELPSEFLRPSSIILLVVPTAVLALLILYAIFNIFDIFSLSFVSVLEDFVTWTMQHFIYCCIFILALTFFLFTYEMPNRKICLVILSIISPILYCFTTIFSLSFYILFGINLLLIYYIYEKGKDNPNHYQTPLICAILFACVMAYFTFIPSSAILSFLIYCTIFLVAQIIASFMLFRINKFFGFFWFMQSLLPIIIYLHSSENYYFFQMLATAHYYYASLLHSLIIPQYTIMIIAYISLLLGIIIEFRTLSRQKAQQNTIAIKSRKTRTQTKRTTKKLLE